MMDELREIVVTATTTLKDADKDGKHPTHEEIEIELARRIREAQEMYQSVARELVHLRNTRL